MCRPHQYTLGENTFCVDEGLVADALIPLKLRRMGDIRQLQLLSTVSVDGRAKLVSGPHIFPHHRLSHSLRAGVLHGIIGEACGLNQGELAIGILADCMHDNFICAGGDSWKDINHQGTLFDEDNNFAGKIWRYCGDGWRWLCNKYGFDPKSTAQTMQEIISGHGLHGEIHEIADTASYMLGDIEEIKRACRRHGYTQDFTEILNVAKHPWDIWNSLVVKDGHIVITDLIALNNFLNLRVLLWANLYNNPARKVLEMLMMKIVYPYMVDRKLIQINDLPTKDDTWLFSTIERQMGWEKYRTKDLNLLGSFPKLKAFATWDQALAFEEEKYNSSAFTLVFSVKDFQKTNHKTDKYWVFGSDGRAGTFKAVCSKHAAVVEEISQNSMSPALPVQVAYAQYPLISGNLRKAWREARAKWKKRIDK
ncbi:MAG: hypothetical protein AAB797_02015 [Patescibacteria group bacterium]